MKKSKQRISNKTSQVLLKFKLQRLVLDFFCCFQTELSVWKIPKLRRSLMESLKGWSLTFKWLQNVGRMRALASATPEVNTGLLMQALIARILALTKGGGQDSLGKLSNISEVSLDRSNGVKTSRKCGYVDTMWSKKTTCPLESITTRSQIIALI